MKHYFVLVLMLVIAVNGSLQAMATETGEISGRLLDDRGEGLAGVVITAAGPNLQGKRVTVSSHNGIFRLPLLPVGTYTLVCEMEGFTTVNQKDVIVRLGRTTDLTVVMKPSAISEEITVTAPTPLIDKSSTDTSYYVSREELERTPVQNRTIVDVVKFTPGVSGVRMNTRRGTATEGQPSFRGEGEEGNSWIVDGLAISGVRLKNSGMSLNLDSIEEIQVISDPFSPEYGSAYGGVINMVTKSGSNDFSGEFSLVFMDKRLQSSRQEQLAVVSEPEYFSNYNWYLNLGGPLIKDKLWFFISDNLYYDSEETRDTTVDYLFVPAGRLSTRNNNLFTKLTYAFNPNHNLSLTSIYHASMGQKGGTGIPEMYEQKDFSDMIFRLNYKGIINATTFIEAGAGTVFRDQLLSPKDGDLGPAMYYVEDLARNVNNSYGNVTDDSRRLDLSFKITKYAETDSFGYHELVAGFEYYAFSSTFAVDFSGQAEDLFPGNGFDAGTKYYFDSWRGSGGTPTFFYEYGDFNFLNSSRGIGLFVKDKVQWGRFTLMAGLRSQTQLCLDHNKEKLWSWGLGEFLSPRLSLSVDLTGNGLNILKLGWGRFSDTITTMPLGLLNSGAGLKFRTYRWNGPDGPDQEQLHDPANWMFENEQASQPFEIADGIRPNFLTRYLVEFDRRLGRDWAVLARYVRTRAADLLEVLALFDATTGYKFLYDNFELKRRNYNGIELEVNGKIGESLYLKASYAYSSAEGTNPGQSETGSWAQDEGSTNHLGLFGNHIYIPDLPALADQKAYYDWALGGLGGRGIGDEGWYGRLPYSIDHNVKINAVFIAPFGFSVAGAFEYISGYYWEKLGYVPFFGGYYAFPEGRGTRKTPGHSYLDMSLEKEIAMPAGLGLSLRFDVFNILNSQKPIAYVKENIPIFGAVWGRQQPRQARAMIKVKW